MPRRSVVILGASPDRAKFGNKSVRAHRKQGYDVYPVNPKGGEIEGLPVYKTLTDVPLAHLDRISVYLPPAIGMAMLEEIAAKGCDELYFNPGSDSDEILDRARELGLEPIQACSIVDLGIRPETLEA